METFMYAFLCAFIWGFFFVVLYKTGLGKFILHKTGWKELPPHEIGSRWIMDNEKDPFRKVASIITEKRKGWVKYNMETYTFKCGKWTKTFEGFSEQTMDAESFFSMYVPFQEEIND